MYLGRSTNNGNGININTRLYTSYSDTCMVIMNAWNANISLRFNPFEGLNSDGIRQYATDNTKVVSTSLTTDNALALIEGVEKEIYPALENHTSASVTISMGLNENRKMLTITTDGSDVRMSIAIHVDDKGMADPNNIIRHLFNKKEYILEYDPISGTGKTVPINTDFKNFVDCIKQYIVLNGSIAHSINYSNAVKNSYNSKPHQTQQVLGSSSNYQKPYAQQQSMEEPKSSQMPILPPQASQMNSPSLAVTSVDNGDMDFIPFS